MFLGVKIPGELYHNHAIYATCFSSPLVYFTNKTLHSHIGSLLLLASRLICFAAIPSRVKVHYWLQAPMMGRQEYGVEMVGLRWTTVSVSMFCWLSLCILLLKLVRLTIWGCCDCGIIVFDVSAHDYLICLEFLQERAWRSIACYSYSMYVLDFTKTGTGMPSLLLNSLHEFIVT